MRVKKILDGIPEILLFLVLLLPIFSFSEFNKKDIICFLLLIAFLVYFMIRMKKRPDIKSGYLIITVFFIILFNMTDKAGTPAFLDAHAGRSGTIPLTTFILVLAFLSYLIKSLAEGKLRLYTGSFFRCLAGCCGFIILLSLLFYPLLKSLYPVNIEPDLQLMNSMLKFLMIAILIADYVSNEAKFRRMSWGFLFTMGLIIVLNVVL
jgi:hypothetical protein